jgi:ATP-dependent helicase/nuclease subunit B
MIQQVRSGRVKAIYFEQRFALRADALFPPIEINLGDEGSIFIEGMIDRIDIINGWEDGGVSHNYVRIIDYKSGNEKFNLEEVKTGWRLQLMLYLKGAMGAVEDSRPAGVFYFAVKEPRIDVTDTPAEDVEGTVKSGMLKSVKLDGAVLDNVSVITGMDENISGLSDIIPVRRKTDGTFSGSTLLTDEEFDELIDINDSNLESLAENLISGCVHIDPKSGKNVSACRYCGYNSICNHE